MDEKTAINNTFCIMCAMIHLFLKDKQLTHSYEEILQSMLDEGDDIDVETIKHIINSIEPYNQTALVKMIYHNSNEINGCGIRMLQKLLI